MKLNDNERAAILARITERDKRPQAARAATAAGRPITAAEATAAGCDILAARLEKGTITPEHAADVLAVLREIDGTSMAAAYTAEQAIAAAVRALHAAENFAAGHGTTERAKCQTWAEQTGGTAFVRLFNLARQAEAEAAKAGHGMRFDRHAAAGETLSDIWDSIQEAACALVENGTIMAHRGGLPLAAGRKAGKPAAVVETFSRTHSAGREAARRFSRAQADKAAAMYHIDFQTMDREAATEAAAIAAVTADAEQARAQAALTAQPQAEADGQSMARQQAAAVSTLAADVVAVLIHWPQIAEAAGMTDAEATGMPSNRAICRTIAAGHAAAYVHAETAKYLAAVTEDTGRKAIDRALQAIAKSGTAAALRQSLREDAEAAHNGRRLLYC